MDEVEQFVDAFGYSFRRPAEQSRNHCDVLCYAHVGKEPHLLYRVSDAPAQGDGIDRSDVTALDEDPARRRFE